MLVILVLAIVWQVLGSLQARQREPAADLE
jgi:hypothetical protein